MRGFWVTPSCDSYTIQTGAYQKRECWAVRVGFRPSLQGFPYCPFPLSRGTHGVSSGPATWMLLLQSSNRHTTVPWRDFSTTSAPHEPLARIKEQAGRCVHIDEQQHVSV